jgi:hypothetical protein
LTDRERFLATNEFLQSALLLLCSASEIRLVKLKWSIDTAAQVAPKIGHFCRKILALLDPILAWNRGCGDVRENEKLSSPLVGAGNLSIRIKNGLEMPDGLVGLPIWSEVQLLCELLIDETAQHLSKREVVRGP